MDEPIKNEEIKSVKFEIELSQDGTLSVKCPVLGDTLFCLGILEMAKATVFQYKADMNKSPLVKSHGIMNFIKSGKRF